MQPRLAMYSTVFKLPLGLVLSCCKSKILFFSGLALEFPASILFRTAMYKSELMFLLDFRKSIMITPLLSQKTVHIILSAEGCAFKTTFGDHCLVSKNVWKSNNVNGCNGLHREEFSGAFLLHKHFHIRCHFT